MTQRELWRRMAHVCQFRRYLVRYGAWSYEVQSKQDGSKRNLRVCCTDYDLNNVSPRCSYERCPARKGEYLMNR
jgi:hypothetical protein